MKNYSFFRALITILFTALLTATLLVFFSPGAEYIDQILPASESRTANNGSDLQLGPRKIVGILPGHYGFNTGYQCGADFNVVK